MGCVKIDHMSSKDLRLSESQESSEEVSNWATIPFEFQDWCREHGSEYGVDTDKLILGELLGSIVGDDYNCFTIIVESESMSKVSHLMRSDLVRRIELEIEAPETPENIRERLREFLPVLLDSDWHKEEEFLRIREQWSRDIKDFVREEIDKNPEYREAECYAIHKPDCLLEGYREYVGGEVVGF